MGIAVFFLLALVAAAAIAYPLLPGRLPGSASPALTDGDIEQACAICGARGSGSGSRACLPGLWHGLPARRPLLRALWRRICPPAPEAAPASTCPSCGATVREGDQFCAKCGHDAGRRGAA